ncbi:acyl-protein synthetase [Bowmanella sp. JS7-9]|uniref:Acyl-protein synthetase n=1 Tax=Pseudobowmanella zhangzhouensis TaxID=1537679 RepID=A0ABW1XGN0_9ALTE|nr:acyl-protein synthetase [Bowmanella sp. JS7-9]
MTDLHAQIDELIQTVLPYGEAQGDKRARLLPIFNQLHQHHLQACGDYARLTGDVSAADSLEALPYVAVRLFKHLRLQSIAAGEVFKTLQSSGTTATTPATVVLDKFTAARQSKALVKILQASLGNARLPMLILDSKAVLKDRALFSARGAGIQGLAMFGRDHTYALDENMQPDWPAIDAFAEKYAGQAVLMFGFTFMVWAHVIEALKQANRRLPFENAILLHSGGWKKLIDQQVSDAVFQAGATEWLGTTQVTNFYGMAEQVGSVFVQCSHRHLHTPMCAEIIVRNPFTLAPCAVGETGLLQVLSVIPTSYPGFSLLTEDMGTLLGEDDCPCGWHGRYFSVQGRLPKTEVRGCSDAS